MTESTPTAPSAPKPERRTPRRLRGRARTIAIAAAVTLGALAVALAGFGLWVWIELSASLPQLDGSAGLPGLSASVEVERDALGVPTIRAGNRADAARALGFVHAQERFFQMDLLRRQAAGELAELFGAAVVDTDKEHRLHRFRQRARARLATLPADQRRILEAYTGGVNAGLAALGAPPPEFFALRERPAPWRTEDSLLAVYAMFFVLQDSTGERESDVGVARETLVPAVAALLTAQGTEWDAPLEGAALETPPLPGPELFDLRREPPPAAAPERSARSARAARFEGGASDEGEGAAILGSNHWALAGAHTADGRALLANDMHLGIAVPNTWFRVSLAFTDAGGIARRMTGVTLPGTPLVAVGSNGQIAWGFTNSYGDWTDLVELEVDPRDADLYQTPDGPRRVERTVETIRVRGERSVELPIRETIWGPIVDSDHRGRPRALAWTAHRPEAINFEAFALESAGTIDDAIAIAHRSGIPNQNFTVADASGRIGWTILGQIPRRIGLDGSAPTSWADGTRGWQGWLRPDEVPTIVDPPSGRLWTANARTMTGEALARIGDGGYDLGARARQIRDRLAGVEKATPRDLLAIQLDDRALFLTRWRDLLLSALSPAALAGHPERAELKRLVETTWTGRASVDSVAYRAVRSFRFQLLDQVFGALTWKAKAADPRFAATRFHQLEGAIWRMVEERPANLLDPRFRSWDEQLLAAVDAYLDRVRSLGPGLADRTWGELNTTRIKHPLSYAVPALGRFLDVPARALPGDQNMPRVQGAGFGASERLVVAPGAEERGIFHMPVGQSGHPLSPFYRAGHQAWEAGEPAPFLPGEPKHRLTLSPGAS